jgi:hypothetical protein
MMQVPLPQQRGSSVIGPPEWALSQPCPMKKYESLVADVESLITSGTRW